MNPLIHDAMPVQRDDGSWQAHIIVDGFTDLADARAWCRDMNDAGALVLNEIDVELESA